MNHVLSFDRLRQMATGGESSVSKSIKDILDDAPAWDGSQAFELLQLCQTHSAVASAIMYSMQVARAAELELRIIRSHDDLMNRQGRIEGLEKFWSDLLTHLQAAEQPEEQDNVEE